MLISGSILFQNLNVVRQQIVIAEKQYGRAANAVKLLAVSKGQTVASIRAVFASGQQAFGENYLQEALEKQQQLTDLDIEWHFIGAIQSNKTRLIATHFDWVHTVSSVAIATRLSRQRPVGLPPLNCCIQVNISREESKAGVLPEELAALFKAIIHLPNLNWRGLMAIPAISQDLNEQREHFAAVQRLFVELKQHYLGLDTLSMGMSADLDAAIAEGATMVRIGTAIFGDRNKFGSK